VSPETTSARLSLAMIVRDEEQTLGRVLEDAAGVFDEMVVLDTGSTDRTRDVAGAHGARVETFEWVADFAAARNAAFDACTGDWIMWLDADDRLPAPVPERLAAWKARLAGLAADAVYVPYHYAFESDGVTPRLSFLRERIIRRGAGLRWQFAVHEVIDVPADRICVADDLWVEHRPVEERRALNVDRNLRILEDRYAAGDRSLRTLFYLGNELQDHQRNSDAVAVYEQYLTTAGLGWERYVAHLYLATCLDRLGRQDEAVAEYLEAVEEDSSRAEAYLQLGLLHYRAGRWTAAVPLLLAATGATRPATGFVVPAHYSYLPWDYLAVCYWRLGRNREALDALAKALPGNPERERLIENATWIVRDFS
jgi:tetratricopeptide (TPR) repeat protein